MAELTFGYRRVSLGVSDSGLMNRAMELDMRTGLTRREFVRGVGVSLGAFYCGLSTAYGGEKKRPNVLWIMMDDCRADALGCYGTSWAKTPFMDEIAGRGVRFETAIIQNPVCVPSRTSMKSGYYAHETGINSMGPAPWKEQGYKPKHTMLDDFTAAGMKPVNVGKIHGFRGHWDSRGDEQPDFDVTGEIRFKRDWAGTPNMERAKLIRQKLKDAGREYPAAVTKTHKWPIGGTVPLEPEEMSTWRMGTLAVDTLEELAGKDEPFFMRVSFHAPHVPCVVPDKYFIDPATIKLPLPTEEELASKPKYERENIRTYSGADLTPEQIGIARGTYYGMVSLVDTQVGRLVDVLSKAGKLDNTIIIINSDQGFQLGEHGFWKKRCFYEQNVKVPFVLSCPALLPGGRVIDEPVEMIDFMPTLLELCGLEVPAGMSGQSLMPLIRGDVKQWKEACFCEHDFATDMYEELRNGGARCVMVRTKGWKLIEFVSETSAGRNGSLYDLKNDPGETVNLYGKEEYGRKVEELRELAKRWQRKA